jgi:hypothetical protein
LKRCWYEILQALCKAGQYQKIMKTCFLFKMGFELMHENQECLKEHETAGRQLHADAPATASEQMPKND